MTIEELIAQAENGLTAQFARIDRMEEIGTRRVLDAFREHQVAYRHFAPTTGYGYDDVGRDTLEKIFAELFGTQAAIVRPQIASGTHAISLCLFANATSGGTDFIAIFLSEKYSIDSWNYIFAGNVVILGIAGALFGWDKALYSIIFQYTSTQVLHILYKRYQKQTLIIVTKRPEDVYEAIAEITHHDATLIKGEGCYSKQECDVLYSVVGRDEVNKVVNTVRKTDPQAFVNMIRTENLAGRFYQRPND